MSSQTPNPFPDDAPEPPPRAESAPTTPADFVTTIESTLSEFPGSDRATALMCAVQFFETCGSIDDGMPELLEVADAMLAWLRTDDALDELSKSTTDRPIDFAAAAVGWLLACDSDPGDWPIERKLLGEIGWEISPAERERMIVEYVRAQESFNYRDDAGGA